MSACQTTLQQFVGDDFSVLDQTLLEQLKGLVSGVSAEDALATLIAMYVLQEVFESEEEEWSLLAKKAKNCLVAAGIEKPNAILKQISFSIR